MSHITAAGASLQVGARHVALPSDGTLALGRDPASDVVLEDPRASWRHAELRVAAGHATITDLSSSNGTWLAGRRLGAEPADLDHDSVVTIGDLRIRYRAARSDAETPAGQRAFRRVRLDHPLSIGRAPNSDIVLDEPNVSWRHARIDPGAPPRVHDLGSRNGTRLGERLVGNAALADGAEIGVGPFRLRYDGTAVAVLDDRAGLRLTAREVGVQVADRTILHPTSIAVAPGEFVALIGESGSGKTTLLKALAGVSSPTVGDVLLSDDPVALRQTDIGYVPQQDTVHEALNVEEALRYAGQLRLPSDTRRDELDAAVAETLADLRLTERAEVRIERLSGGQRKRTAVGTELIARPTMLLLDEPTSGLDPGLERRLMESLRGLADSGRGVVVVTHATSSLALCDTVAVMGRGGYLRFLGAPQDALAFFAVGSYDEIYHALEAEGENHATGPRADGLAGARSRPGRLARSGVLPGRSFVRQTRILTARYARTFLRDRRTLLALIGQVPIIALCIGALFPGGLLSHPDDDPARTTQFVFMLVTAALWLGLISTCREIVKERSIVIREVSVGVRLDAYLAAKLAVLLPLTAIQATLLLAVTCLLQPLHEPVSAYLQLLAVLIATAWASAALGLAVSTFARSVDQATSFVPLLLIPQLLFAGALVPHATMRGPIKVVSDLIFARWAYAGSGRAIDLNARFLEDPKFRAANSFGQSFFHLPTTAALIVLFGFTAVFVLLAGVFLARRVDRPE